MFIKKITTRDASRINYLLVTVLFCCIAYFSLGYSDEKGYFIDTHYTGTQMPLDWTATEVAEWAGGADVGTYINAAKYYIENGEFKDWVVNLFPPGQMYYSLYLIKLTSEDCYPLKLLLTSLTLWLFVFLAATMILNRKMAHIGIPFIVMLPMYFTGIREYVFGYGILGAEMLAMPLFVLLVFLLLLFHQEYRNKKYLAAVALILAVLSYLRGYFEIFGNFSIVMLLLLIVVNLIIDFFKSYVRGEVSLSFGSVFKELWGRKNHYFGPKMQSIAIVLIIFSILLLPWRFSNVERGFSMSWLHAGYYWGLVWKTDDATHPAFRNTGINTPCRTDPSLCEILFDYENKSEGQSIPYSMYGRLAVFTFLTKPITWYKNKLQYLDNLWYGKEWRNEASDNTGGFMQGLIMLISPLIFFVYYFINWKSADAGYRAVYMASIVFVIFNIMLFTLLHFEMRYSIFIKLLFVSMLVLLMNDILGRVVNKINKLDSGSHAL